MNRIEFPPLQLDTDSEQSRCRKSTAGILGVLLGAFGLHRLYLGYRRVSALQVICTLLTAGLAGLWGTCEGLMILGGRFRYDAEGRVLRNSRLAYVPAAHSRLAKTRYRHSRSSPWLMTVMVFFFPLSNSIVLAAIWTLAGWSFPGMLVRIPDLIPPPGGENWVVANQPISLVVEVITRDPAKQERDSDEATVRLELFQPAWNEASLLPVPSSLAVESPALPRSQSRFEASWNRPDTVGPVLGSTIRPQRLARAGTSSSRDHYVPQLPQEPVNDFARMPKRSREIKELTRELLKERIAQQVPREPVAGGSIVTPGVVQPTVRPVYNPSPKYPEEALSKRQEGLVKIRIGVAANGSVLTARVVQTSKNRDLDAAALQAVKRWRFSISSELPVKQPVEVIVPIRFRIESP